MALAPQPRGRGGRTSGLNTKVPPGPQQVRPERVWHGGVRPLLPARWRAAVPGGEHAEPAAARLLSVGRVLQLAGRHDHDGRGARRAGREGSAERPLLGHRQRAVGLRWRLLAGRVCGRVPALHVLGAGLRRRPAVHRRGPQRPGVRVDASVLRQAHRREQGHGAAPVGVVGAPLLDQRQRRTVERLEREQGPGRRVHARAVVRAAEGRRSHSTASSTATRRCSTRSTRSAG